MSRHVSLFVLLAIVALIAVLFFHVIKPFLVVIFIAIVLAVLFHPVHEWLSERIGGHDRLAAGATTLLVLVLVLIPVGATLLMAGNEMMEVGEKAVSWLDARSTTDMDETFDRLGDTRAGDRLHDLYLSLSPQNKENVRDSVSRLSQGVTAEAYEKTREMLGDFIQFVIGLGVMMLSVYYFLAEGDSFLRELHRLLPLGIDEESALLDRFKSVCRGVVLGTILSGMAQATLAGIAFAVLGLPNVWLLAVLTMVFSFVPFLGAAAVWIPVSLLLLVEQRYAPGIGLAVFGAGVISTCDNLVRAYVIGNQARLHPLVALVTVIGALQLIGLWGIFVGPMVAAFFYALLNIAHKRVVATHQEAEETDGHRLDKQPPSRPGAGASLLSPGK